ncbi:hypothetical protein MA16_Dca001268 [Dendrobium catenatum]|uniref:Uncharacterized protein n=1 Tax=Dendrobium catenatum TaxID=906689 RepID=A0A2I0WLY5_9ASPA|nr:hypothetical protein MA16_Dca001268 [Dendrobium catenatum]
MWPEAKEGGAFAVGLGSLELKWRMLVDEMMCGIRERVCSRRLWEEPEPAGWGKKEERNEEDKPRATDSSNDWWVLLLPSPWAFSLTSL